LTWTGSAGATGYIVQRSPDGTTWTQVGSAAATSFTDSCLNPSTTYSYRILASNSAGNSLPSNVATATTASGAGYCKSPQGNWVGTYGTDGYDLFGWNGGSDLVSLPQSTLVLDQGNRAPWLASTTDIRALQSPDTAFRRATTLYDLTQLRLHLNFASAYTGVLHLYAVDWDSTARRETITVDDGSGPQTATISTDFSQGAWTSFPITVSSGRSVTITVSMNAGGNAVLSGLFLR
jgi:hypothetical protein